MNSDRPFVLGSPRPALIAVAASAAVAALGRSQAMAGTLRPIGGPAPRLLAIRVRQARISLLRVLAQNCAFSRQFLKKGGGQKIHDACLSLPFWPMKDEEKYRKVFEGFLNMLNEERKLNH